MAADRRLSSSRGGIDALNARSGCSRKTAARQALYSCGLPGHTRLRPGLAAVGADAVCWLCQHGADVTKVKVDDWKDTALHYAAASGRLPAVQALLAAGSNPAAKNYAGEGNAHGCAACTHACRRMMLHDSCAWSLSH